MQPLQYDAVTINIHINTLAKNTLKYTANEITQTNSVTLALVVKFGVPSLSRYLVKMDKLRLISDITSIYCTLIDY